MTATPIGPPQPKQTELTRTGAVFKASGLRWLALAAAKTYADNASVSTALTPVQPTVK